MRIRTVAALGWLTITLLTGRLGASAQVEPPIQIWADGARPLATAVEELERRFGWVVTYEEGPYLDASGIRDATQEVRRDGAASPRVLVPDGVPFAFSFLALSPEERVLQALMDGYGRSGNSAEFRLDRTGVMFHVVPAAIRNQKGELETYGALLDTRISLPDGERSAYDMVQSIVRAVEGATGARLMIGTVPTNLFLQTIVQGGARNEPARTVLIRTLSATKRQLSWRLLSGPDGDPTQAFYALNIHLVKAAH